MHLVEKNASCVLIASSRECFLSECSELDLAAISLCAESDEELVGVSRAPTW